MKITFLDSITDADEGAWDKLFPGGNPFVRHAFLRALEDSGSVCEETGWQPRHLVAEKDGNLVAAMPLYLKSHSYGEFVFDWSWAQAYEEHGRNYYPKLLTAIPFTPSVGPRLGIASGQDSAGIVPEMMRGLYSLARDKGLSGWHILFPDKASRSLLPEAMEERSLLQRRDVQFHWLNHGYASFDDYLAVLKSSRRKNLRRERRQVAEQGISLERRCGGQISDEDWKSFYMCYVSTYLKRSGHGGYLNREFFRQVRKPLADHLMMVTAKREGKAIASALFFYDEEALYGRYWGALENVHCLHFEACFYQGIEFCIERGLKRFDPGTQGEHKLLRGFEPISTYSYHWIADRRFGAAIAAFLEREKSSTAAYGKRAAKFLPFRKE